MKALKKIPSFEDLFFAYQKLYRFSPLPLSKILLWSQWCRLDPRLVEYWVPYVAKNWKFFKKDVFRKKTHVLPWPATVAVLIEHVELWLRFYQKPLVGFKRWKKDILKNISKASGEMFCTSAYFPGGKRMEQAVEKTLNIYKKWGYFESYLLIREDLKEKCVLLEVATRQKVLALLCKSQKSVSVDRYWEALGRWVPFQVAKRDLEKALFLKKLSERVFQVKRPVVFKKQKNLRKSRIKSR